MFPLQATHWAPMPPHTEDVVPDWQVPVASQQPRQLEGPQGGGEEQPASRQTPDMSNRRSRVGTARILASRPAAPRSGRSLNPTPSKKVKPTYDVVLPPLWTAVCTAETGE